MEILKDLENGQRKHLMGNFRKNILQSQILWNSISHRKKKVIKTRITKTEHKKGDSKMEKKDFKKGQKAILLSLKNVDFRKTMDIDAATEECTVVKVGRKYITVEDSHGWEIRFDMENNFEEVDDSFSYTRSELYLSKEDAKKVLKRRYLIKAIEKSLHDMSWSTFDGISDQALQNLHTALIAVEKERIVLKSKGKKKMEIKWETMDYIAFILLGMLTIFCGNKQLQQLVAGLYIALAIWYVYTIIYEVKRYRQQKKDINSFTECLENVKKVQRIPDDIEMQKIGSGLVTFPSNFDGTFYAIKIRAGEFIAVHEKLYCMLTESSNIILLQAKSPIAAYELAVGESMIIDNRKLAAASSSLICEGKFLQTLYQMLGIRKRYEEKIIGPGRLWLTDTPIKEEES